MPASDKTPETFFASLPKKHLTLAKKLQKTLLKINPSYKQKYSWKGLCFKRGTNYSCIICPYADHLKLMIWRGTRLEDPEERLRGSGGNTRHLVIRNEPDLHPTYVKMLLEQQFKLYDAGVPWEEPCSVRKSTTMPASIKKSLQEHNLMEAYKNRPPYQRRDYLHWITQAKRPATQESRLHQMLDELAAGDRYMKQPYRTKSIS